MDDYRTDGKLVSDWWSATECNLSFIIKCLRAILEKEKKTPNLRNFILSQKMTSNFEFLDFLFNREGFNHQNCLDLKTRTKISRASYKCINFQKPKKIKNQKMFWLMAGFERNMQMTVKLVCCCWKVLFKIFFSAVEWHFSFFVFFLAGEWRE